MVCQNRTKTKRIRPKNLKFTFSLAIPTAAESTWVQRLTFGADPLTPHSCFSLRINDLFGPQEVRIIDDAKSRVKHRYGQTRNHIARFIADVTGDARLDQKRLVEPDSGTVGIDEDFFHGSLFKQTIDGFQIALLRLRDDLLR